ncbi:hypothetical protein [Curtobacterium sp. MCBA15_008]|uniref:hypothetical protein n=1 Tax=Curtobacterium sp. MCBA15_008 TaxID=1898736 RepID=UPI0008DD6413|nr:hypothetical protein [Curtobacterium sp. MCBA15_008]OII09025.1 hypothetical protein BIU96_03740 [Curtobacterium sp. MCBA15_008]
MLTLLVVGTVALTFLVVLWVIPTSWLLPVALLVAALVPVSRLPLPEAITVISPGAVVILAWIIRRDRTGLTHPTRIVATIGLLLIGWLVIGVLSGISVERGLGWGTAFTLLVLVFTFERRIAALEARRLLDTWMWTGAALAVFGVVERLLGSNPLYGRIFASGEYPIFQYWSDYRITTTLGHPLNNALFLSVATVIAIARFVERGRASALLAAGLGLVGVFLTISRGGLVAVAVGVAVIVVGPLFRRSGTPDATSTSTRGLIALGVAGVGLVGVTLSPVFQERLSSSNGLASARARDELVPLVLSTSQHLGYLGSGPGTSNVLLQERGTPVVVENSWFQLLLSLGLPGVCLVAALIVTAAIMALRSGSLSAAAALAALSTSAAGFNWIESDRPGMLFLGVLVAAAMSERERQSERKTEAEAAAAESPRAGVAGVRPRRPARAPAVAAGVLLERGAGVT